VPDCPGLFTAITQDVLVAPFNDIAATESIIAAHAGDLAAVIVEPVLGSAGVIPATREYLQALKVACESSGALLIFDEVVTLRLAVGGAQSLYGVTPDLTAMGKIIGGGFPIGAFGGRAEVMAQYDPTQHRLHQGGTYNGNAVSMVAGKVALELLDAAEIDRLNRLGDSLRSQLNAVLASSGLQGHVAGIGSLLQLHLGAQAPVRHYRDTLADEKRAHEAMHLALLNHGFFGAKRGEYALSTPMTEADTALAVQRFRAALGDLDRRGRAGEAS
jgi:glutamate-1-semialdehyde 2,1-aminomutase